MHEMLLENMLQEVNNKKSSLKRNRNILLNDIVDKAFFIGGIWIYLHHGLIYRTWIVFEKLHW